MPTLHWLTREQDFKTASNTEYRLLVENEKYSYPPDGGEKGVEFQCAKAIDAEQQVKYWLRNIARHPASFKLPTSTDYFYPDFIA
jgi:hypothetical protein